MSSQRKIIKTWPVFLCVFLVSGCAVTETHRSIETIRVEAVSTHYSGAKTTLVVAGFQNRSSYMQGLFSAKEDHLGHQAKAILKTHLQQTRRFKLVDRENLEKMKQEAELNGVTQQLRGARYTVAGSVTGFGRKVAGDRQLFGILGAGKKQIAYAKVSFNVIDVITSEVVYSAEGAGEYVLSSREVVGFGGNAGYDATLNAKVLNLAIRDAVNNLVEGIKRGAWNIQY